MVYVQRNDKRSQVDISSIILVYKLQLQSVMLDLGLGHKANIFGLGLHRRLAGEPCTALKITAHPARPGPLLISPGPFSD